MKETTEKRGLTAKIIPGEPFLVNLVNLKVFNPIFITSLCYNSGTEKNTLKTSTVTQEALIKVRRILVIKLALTLIEFLDNIT